MESDDFMCTVEVYMKVNISKMLNMVLAAWYTKTEIIISDIFSMGRETEKVKCSYNSVKPLMERGKMIFLIKMNEKMKFYNLTF